MEKKVSQNGGTLYYPAQKFKEQALLSDPSVYQKALENPVAFWEELASELFWFKKWKKGFSHKPPFFKWFEKGKINLTANIFERDWDNRKDKKALVWEPEPVEEEPRVFTYSELKEEVEKCASFLKKNGVKKGDRVGVYLPMIPEIVVVMLACLRIGAVHSVVFSAFSPSALRVRLQDTEAKILFTADNYHRRGNVIDLEKNARQGAKDTKVKKIFVLKRSGKDHPWEKEEAKAEPEKMDASDIQFILYTSGSTGKPKGCVHACGGYTVQAYWTGKWIFDFHEDDVFWCTSDPGWITGHTYTIYSPLLNGICTLMFEGAPDWPEPDRWAEIIEKHQVSVFYTAPTAIRMFEKYGKEFVEKHNLEKLRLLGSVGEPIDESAWQWYFENVGKGRCPIVDTWWQTETGGIVITSLPGMGPFRPAFTGLPFPGVKMDILDEKGNSCPPEKQGSLVMLPPFVPSLLRGVYKNKKRYLKTYWSQFGKEKYFTSDTAYKDKNGLIRIVGRADDAIKVAGHRLTTGELEAAINLHPEITECAVIGVPDKIKGEVPAAFVVYKGERPEEEIKKEIVGKVVSEISPVAKPKQVYLVEDLPKTRSGKIMRRILRKLFTGEDLGDLSTLANPQTVEEIKIKIK